MCRQVPTPERSAPDNLLVYCFQCTQWAQNSNLGTYIIFVLNILIKLKLLRLNGQCLPDVQRADAY